MEFVVHGICITSVGLAGLVANVLCLLVLRRPALKRGRSQVKEKKKFERLKTILTTPFYIIRDLSTYC